MQRPIRCCAFVGAIALGLLVGCGPGGEPDPDGGDAPRDAGPRPDGATPPVDAGCAADEVACDGVDDDCDGTIDEGVLSTLYRDADGDGAGDPSMSREGCPGEAGWSLNDGDCDDDCATCHWGADEVCDGRDNDCDGETDERGADGPCQCFEETHAGHDYLFCRGAYARAEALAYCRDGGYELAKIEDQDEQDWIWTSATATGEPQDWWIGLEDQAAEGVYVWSDGTPLGSYDNWNADQPDDGGEAADNEDCVELNQTVDGHWNDLGCELDYLSFICETAG